MRAPAIPPRVESRPDSVKNCHLMCGLPAPSPRPEPDLAPAFQHPDHHHVRYADHPYQQGDRT
jgi:hypothetical protein